MRARHWLALLAAFSLIVVAWLTTTTDGEPTVAAGERDRAKVFADGLIEASTREVEEAADLRRPGVLANAESESGPAATEGEGTERGEPSAASVGPVGPLTGLPVNGDLLDRPAMVVKIDNHPDARPQTGLDRADIVFDLRAEGVTRFAAVFHSEIPDPLGPVRSSRTSDFDLLTGFNRPLYGSSGANNFVAQAIGGLPVVEVTALSRTEYFRSRSRPAPHNLYVNGSDLMALAPSGSGPPPAWFHYRADGDDLPDDAAPVAGPVTVDFTGSPTVTHEWDSDRGGWLRAQDGVPHTVVDAEDGGEGRQLAPANVVIMITDYSTSAADPISPEVRSTGSGPVVVLLDGHVVTGTWDRPDADGVPTLETDHGEPIELTPGQTWVLMPEAGQVDFEVDRFGATASGRGAS